LKLWKLLILSSKSGASTGIDALASVYNLYITAQKLLIITFSLADALEAERIKQTKHHQPRKMKK